MMKNTFVFWTGIFGVTLFVIASILGGFQFDDYNPISQYISETYATGTPYGETLRYFCYIPAGILFTLFSFSALRTFPESRFTKIGFWGLGIFYGLTTIGVALFPCDFGCNKAFVEPSTSQIIHNLLGFLTYVFVPISLIGIGIGLRQLKDYTWVSNAALVCGFISIFFVGLLFANPLTDFAGLYQRIIEGAILSWILLCAVFLFKHSRS